MLITSHHWKVEELLKGADYGIYDMNMGGGGQIEDLCTSISFF